MNIRDLSIPQLQKLSLDALLDDKQAICTAVANELSRRLHGALGNKCPECGSTNCCADDEQGECNACGETWAHEDLGFTTCR